MTCWHIYLKSWFYVQGILNLINIPIYVYILNINKKKYNSYNN